MFDKISNKKILMCGIIVAALLLIGGAIVVVASMNKEDTTQEEELEEQKKEKDKKKEQGKEEEDSDKGGEEKASLGGIIGYVDTSRKNSDCILIGSMMDVLQIAAADPAITWRTEEVVVVFTKDGLEYQSENADVIKFASDIMPPDTTKVSQWSDGWELRAKIDLSTGVPVFSFRGDYEELKEFKIDLASRIDVVLEK